MAKKSFKGGLDTLLGNSPEESKSSNLSNPSNMSNISKPKKLENKSKPDKPNNNNGAPPTNSEVKEIRATFILNSDHHEKIKGISYWDRREIKNIMSEFLEDSLNRYEKKNGKIKLNPKVKNKKG